MALDRSSRALWALAFRSLEVAFKVFSSLSLPHTKHHTCWFFLLAWWQRGGKMFFPILSALSLTHQVEHDQLWVRAYHPKEKLTFGSIVLGGAPCFFFSIWDSEDRGLPSCFLLYCIMPPSAGRGNLLSWEDGEIEAMCVAPSSVEWGSELNTAFLIAFRALDTT